MTKLHEQVPPFGSGWHWFCQATDPATDPNNYVGPGKLWVETDADTAPTVVVALHIWNTDDSGWLAFPIGTAGSVADGDYGDIVVSGTGATWSFDTSVVTAAAKTVLDDASVAAMLATLGGAPLASPTFTGTPSLPTGTTAVTQSPGDNSTKLSTTAYADAAAAAASGAPTNADYLVKTANGSLSAERVVTDTTTIETDWGTAGQAKIKIVSSAPLPGSPTTTTQSAGDNSTKVSTTAYADNAVAKQPEAFPIAVSDETTAITTGDAKITFHMPFAFTLTSVVAGLSTVSSSGAVTVDINESGSTIFSTKITIDQSEETSTTAATPAVLSDTSIAQWAKMTVDIDGAGTGAKGLKLYFIGTRT